MKYDNFKKNLTLLMLATVYWFLLLIFLVLGFIFSEGVSAGGTLVLFFFFAGFGFVLFFILEYYFKLSWGLIK